MNPSDTLSVLAKAQLLDGRRPVPTEADVAAWHEIIGRYAPPDCLDAVTEHYGRTSDWLTPAHVVAIVDARRRARREQHAELTPNRSFALTRNGHGQEIPADREDVERYFAEYRELTRLVMDGEWTSVQVDAYRASGLDLGDFQRCAIAASPRRAVTA